MAKATADAQVRFLKIGKVNYSYVRRVRGQLVGRPLGSKAKMTLTEARSAAVAVDAELRSGSAPAQKVKRQAVTLHTLQQLWDRYLTVHAKPRKKSWRFDVDMWDRYVAGAVPLSLAACCVPHVFEKSRPPLSTR